jgi:iron complex outermembrane receptor protein
MRNFKNLPTCLSGLAFIVSALIVPSGAALAQDDDEEQLEEITVTGTRIQDTNVVAASAVTTIGMDEIDLKMTPNIERVFRDLPITIPGDGENVNNGTAGQATIDLRGLGQGRMLVMIDGQRLAPYDIDGIATIDVIPVNMLERVEVVTGGASAVYGSDAMSGAVNFILRDDFEGFEVGVGYSDTDSGQESRGGGEDTTYFSALFGTGFADDRGHIVIGGGFTDRGSVLLEDRTFGLFGVDTASGAGLGSPPDLPTPDCSGNSNFVVSFDSGAGSTTTIPGTLDLLAGSPLQFRDDMSVGARCSRFNFNPFNYYQTPQERWQSTALASYDYNDNVEFYARVTTSSNTSAFRIAPSGTFGQPFTIPVANPFFNDTVRQTIIGQLIQGASDFVTSTQQDINDILALPNPTQDDLDTLAALQDALAEDPTGWNNAGMIDNDNNGVFDVNDSFTSTARRRTIELGPRTGIYDTDYFQYVLGVRGNLPGAMESWNYDVSYNRGESDFVETRDGFTNLTNLAFGINTVDPDQCISPQGVVTPAPCTPINVFGPEGSITAEQRDSGYFIAIASDLRKSTLAIWSASISGTIDAMTLPTADSGLALAVGFDNAQWEASSSPDECLKLPPASCQGGAGGNRLPISGAYEADEWFVEAILPIAQGRTGFENLSLELGWRTSDFDIQGTTDTWKAGFSWEFIPGFRFRFMEQEAVRVANVGELFSPITTGLDNATFDPCSVGNPNPPAPGSELFQRCVASGMLPSQVGTASDIISGQINVFNGTNPNALPEPEEASTTTFGFVWEPEIDFLTGTAISVDYYDIEIENYIAEPTGQEALDICYVVGSQFCLDNTVRIGGTLSISGAGVPAYVTNFVAFRAEGIDLNVSTGFDAGNIGEFGVSYVGHKYLTQEFQTTAASPVVDCAGRYGTSCDPINEYRHTLRMSWFRDNFDASLLWRHLGSMDLQANEVGAVFDAFESIDSFNYIDLNVGYTYRDWGRIALLVNNIFDEDPPIIGNDTGTTGFNSGNTFPSLYDTMGRVYAVHLKLTF